MPTRRLRDSSAYRNIAASNFPAQPVIDITGVTPLDGDTDTVVIDKHPPSRADASSVCPEIPINPLLGAARSKLGHPNIRKHTLRTLILLKIASRLSRQIAKVNLLYPRILALFNIDGARVAAHLTVSGGIFFNDLSRYRLLCVEINPTTTTHPHGESA